MKKIIITSIFVLFTAPLLASEGTPKIKAVAKPLKTTIGVPVEYKITIAGKKLGKFTIQPPKRGPVFIKPKKKNRKKTIKKSKKNKKKDNKKKEDKPSKYIPAFIINKAKKEDNSQGNMTDIIITIGVTFYRPGKYTLPLIKILDEKKNKIGYKSPTVDIQLTNKKGKFEEIEPPLSLSGNYRRLIILIIAAVLATLLGVIIFRFIKKRIKKTEPEPEVIPPIDIFEKDIEELAPRKLIVDGDVEGYVFGISMVFRRFLSAQLEFDAIEMTSDEIDKKLQLVLTKIKYEKYGEEILKVFQLWDLSKYAEFAPSEEVLLSNSEETIKLAKRISREMSNVVY